VLHPEHLFRPFQPGAQSTGLGVYLSRALMRSFRGELRYEPEPPSGRGQAGSTFVVELSTVLAGQLPGAANLPDAVKLPEAVKLKEGHGTGNPDSTGGRPQSVPGQPQPVVAD
jgi:hypothetical protein